MPDVSSPLLDRATAERFWSKVEKTDTCWLWTGAPSAAGYGRFWLSTGQQYAHRLVYSAEVDSIPAGMMVDHVCHIRRCVNPAHLRVVTLKQNLENTLGARSDSSTGVRGVRRRKASGRLYVVVKHNHRVYWGGSYGDLAEAEQAAIALRNRLFTHNDSDRPGFTAGDVEKYQEHRPGTGTGSQQASKTYCAQGHPYDEANTAIRPNGRHWRRCKTCNREAARRYRTRAHLVVYTP